ncbi:MAG TPA: CRISPR-associated ring nuclease Csm6, partial [Rhodanobacteraceae bacterium]|nr:CRISPR-associated ring nuclease Csm6 [Rhodanobacteraceae bacterium]
MTPQVVTETVFALVHLGEPWIPTEVHIITTSTGAHRAKLLLLAPGQDQFGSLCREYALPPIAFDVNNIHVVANADGQKLEDVRNQADNMAVADMILSKMAGFAADRTCAMHVSLAGGRKSMGFFAGYALSLYGRAQDRLSHVLVSPGFETHPEFFFPPKTPRVLLTQGGTPVSTSDARIELADIPFVRLRDRLPDELLSGGRFADAVAAAQRLEAAPRLRVDLASRSVQCADTKIRLAPMNFAVYAWLAKRRLEKGPGAVPVADFNAIHSSLRNELYCFGCKLFDNPMS